MRRFPSLLTICLCVMAYALPLAAEEAESNADDADSVDGCEVEAFFAGVQCIDADGVAAWQIHHPSLWSDGTYYEDIDKIALDEPPQGPAPVDSDSRRHERFWVSDDADLIDGLLFPFAEPITLGDRTFYSSNFHLLELDVEKGAIIDRVRFPAPITALEADGDASLMVTLVFHEEGGFGRDSLDIRYALDGPVPSQADWLISHPDVSGAASLRSARVDFEEIHRFLMNDINPEGTPYFYQVKVEDFEDRVENFDDHHIEALITRLKAAQTADQTNPYYDVYIGFWHQVLGDDDAADQAFERALETPNAHWLDWVYLSDTMETYGLSEIGDRAFELGAQGADAVGIAAHRRSSTLGASTTLQRLSDFDDDVLSLALKHGDADKAHRLSLRRAQLFPNLEDAHISWFKLADWMEDHDRSDLAEEWTERAEYNQTNSCGVQGPGGSWTPKVIRNAVIVGTISLAALILLFLVGLRAGAARRRHIEDQPAADDSGLRSWMPKPGRWDLLLLGTLFAALVIVPPLVGVYPQAMETISHASIELGDDALASPNPYRNVEALADSPARTELLAIMDAEHQALVAGEALPDKEAICPLLMEAVITDAQQTQWQSVKDLTFIDVAYQNDFGGVSVGNLKPAMIPILLLILALIFVIGALVGRKAPRLTRLIRYVVPGAILRPAPLADLALLATVGALTAINFTEHPLYTQVNEFNVADNTLGLDAIDAGGNLEPSSLITAGLSILALIAVAHLAFVILDIRAWRAQSNDDATG